VGAFFSGEPLRDRVPLRGYASEYSTDRLGTSEIVRTRRLTKVPPEPPPEAPPTEGVPPNSPPVTSEFVRTRRSVKVPPSPPGSPPYTGVTPRVPRTIHGGAHDTSWGARPSATGGSA
jgi:hypothetical protein